MLELSSSQRKHLKKLAHSLKPVLTVGKNGLSDAVTKELECVLESHELIKAKVAIDDRDQFKEMCIKISELSNSAVVTTIGRIGIFYRAATEPKITLPS